MAAIAPTSQIVFGSRLLQQLLKRKEPNVFVSPASVGLALGMAAAGARGKTLAAFEHALGVDATLAADWAQRLLASLDSLPPGVALELANSLWAPPTTRLSPQYIDTMRRSYRAEVRNLDFASREAERVINDWAARATHGLIDSAVDSIDPASIMVLVNATYFKGLWEDPFDPQDTLDWEFTTGSGGQTNVRMMMRRDSFSYLQDRNLQAVRLPYKEGRFSLLVVLPREPLSSAGFQDIAAPSSLAQILGGLETKEGLVGLPKVRLTYKADLRPELSEMGMEPAFSDDADFSGSLEGGARAFISKVSHRTRLEIDETGTTAAATTSVEMSLDLNLTRPRPFQMVVDRPFLLVLTDNESDLIVFVGVIGNPNP
jgi:serine protease inhibitor